MNLKAKNLEINSKIIYVGELNILAKSRHQQINHINFEYYCLKR
jgi:hypothetical protein